MPAKILLVGHCGPDSSYLRMTLKKAIADAEILSADDSRQLNKALETKQVDLILLNRQLDFGFHSDQGVEVIRALRATHPDVRTMLVSNYPEAQQAAIAAGALPGFGKSELGTPRVTELLQNALGVDAAK